MEYLDIPPALSLPAVMIKVLSLIETMASGIYTYVYVYI